MEVDLGRKLHFPDAVLSSILGSDIIVWSPERRKVIMMDLTVLWVGGCEEAAEKKKDQYQQLVHDCLDKGWTTYVLTVEVGCQGFPAQSVWKCSCWLWHTREDTSWKSGRERQWRGSHRNSQRRLGTT